MGLECLRGLIQKNYLPKIVVIHKEYELEKKFNDFYLPMEELCGNYDIPLIKTSKISDIKNNFKDYSLGICAGFMEILDGEILCMPKNGIFNLHCGKLPFYRGRAPISRTIMDGNETLTMTLHKMDAGVDSGDILEKTEIKIETDDDVNTLYKKCCDNSADLVISGIDKLYSSGNIDDVFVKQDISLKPKANKKISEEERKISWDDDITKIHNLIRAITSPYPCAYTLYDDKKYLIAKSEIFSIEKCKARQPGEIYFVDEDYFLINCNGGLLKIIEITDEENNIINPEKVFKQRGILK
jgi:methionyl-tRNA formyltransferase